MTKAKLNALAGKDASATGRWSPGFSLPGLGELCRVGRPARRQGRHRYEENWWDGGLVKPALVFYKQEKAEVAESADAPGSGPGGG